MFENKRLWITLVLTSLTLSACVTISDLDHIKSLKTDESTKSQPQLMTNEIDWQVINRFRVIKDEAEENRFYADLAAYWEESWKWSDHEKNVGPFPNFLFSDLVHHRRNSTGHLKEENYQTFYDNKKYRYDYTDKEKEHSKSNVKWALDKRRKIRANWPKGGKNKCIWKVTNKITSKVVETKVAWCHLPIEPQNPKDPNFSLCDQQEQVDAPCFELSYGKKYSLSVYRKDQSEFTSEAEIEIEDTLIVAMGDSFSSGEGNPHMQWRFLGEARPASWWDARCHRSLLSGPSLAAAIYAKKHTRKSTTFLHYGCSGASIDDGLVRPWRLHETSEKRNKRHNNILYKLLGYREIAEDQETPCVGQESKSGDLTFEKKCNWNESKSAQIHADILPSQIAMAAHDLDQDSQFPSDTTWEERANSKTSIDRQPDYLLISIGGNDIGFASLVQSAAIPIFQDKDLSPDPPEDFRSFPSSDEKRFTENAIKTDALLNCILGDLDECQSDKPLEHYQHEHVIKEILGEHPQSKSRQKLATLMVNARHRVDSTIPNQYALLQDAIEKRIQPTKVIVTAYPSALTYYSKDGAIKYCADHTLDGRPGLIPSPFNALRSFGIGVKRTTSEKANEHLLKYLNDKIANRLENTDWVFAHKKFFNLSKPFGYCSTDGRMFNTFIDAGFFQGFSARGYSPIGSIDVSNVSEKTMSSTAIWDVSAGCYKTASPKTLTTTNQCMDGIEPTVFRYHVDRERTDNKPIKNMPIPSGTFHPTVLGHCMYALGLVDKIDPAIQSIPDNPSSQSGGNNWQLTALKQLCSANTLGFQSRRKS